MSHPCGVSRFLAVGLVASLVGLLLMGPGLAQTDKGRKYALLVGVRKYDHKKLEDLKYTENDVEELADALKGFSEVVVLTSTRGEKKAEAAPTIANIRSELRRLLKRVTKHDTVVVGLAGHGLQLKVKVKGMEAEEGFFCPSDARPLTEATLAEQSETMLGFTELFRTLDDSGVGVKLLLVDACRNDPKAGRSINADAMPRAPKGMAALFSCRTGERAFETEKLGKGHGIFFHHVIQGLKGEAKNKRGEVTWSSLADYVVEKVSDEVPVLIGGGAKQTPEEIKKLEGKPPVLIASLGRRAGTGDPPARKEILKKNSQGNKKAGKERPYLKVYIGSGFSLETDDLEITDVYAGSPAEKAGLKAGDVIVAIDGKKIATRDGLTAFLQTKKPGDKVTIEVQRDKKPVKFAVILGRRPAE
jgi:hypothetical protein